MIADDLGQFPRPRAINQPAPAAPSDTGNGWPIVRGHYVMYTKNLGKSCNAGFARLSVEQLQHLRAQHKAHLLAIGRDPRMTTARRNIATGIAAIEATLFGKAVGR